MREKRVQSLDEILGDFNPIEQASSKTQKRCLSIWMAADLVSRYEAIQKASGRRFCKKLQEIIRAAIEMAEARI